MGAADFFLVSLIKDAKRVPNWQAGHKFIDGLEKDSAGRIENSTGMRVTPESLHEDLKYVESEWANGARGRESTTIEVMHLTLWLSGGQSFGEDPTKFFTKVLALDDVDIGILRAVGFHLPEDTLDFKGMLMKILKNKQLLPLLVGVDKELDKLITPKLKGKK